ncbi:MAG: hypothetical protein ACOYM3_05875 [Terrimicrobiaceae bacterium]
METISLLDVRRNAKILVGRLIRGESFRITYRNRLVGELFPLRKNQPIEISDPVYAVSEHAEDLGGTLDARAADALIYQ